MQIDIKIAIEQNPNLKRYLKENSYWYNYLNRNPIYLKAMEEEMKKKYKLTPEEKLISDDFAKNRGKLPWPVEQGFVSEKFGVNVHPVFKQVKLNNAGITITTSRNADVRAVFKGVVTEIMFIPGDNNVVIVRHGNYLTVYSNLVEIFIKKGDTVNVKQKIGKLAVSSGNNSTLNFQVWRDKDNLDPQLWLTPW